MANTTKLYNISGNLISDVQIKNNSNGKPFALARVQGAKRATTVMTHVKAGIAALEGRKAGEAVRLFGTYVKGDKGQTFSAMGLSPERPAAQAAA
jgi:hypothetical protein